MRIFKTDPPSSIIIQTLATVFPSLSPARVPRIPPAPHLGRTLARLPNAAVGHRPGIPRTPRSRRPVRLAITAVPEKRADARKTGKKPRKTLPNFP
jgi:hypothetical protein